MKVKEYLMLSEGYALQWASPQSAIDAEIASTNRDGSPFYVWRLFCDTFSLPMIARGLERRAPRISNTHKMSKQPLSSLAKRRDLQRERS
ncbi:hypothetical protein [Bradyrhizobium sp. WSM471]|uniref:hypothetical protein n=1 Tax=Bradyrhizobium sp. WSM471 TaxID=319017 RepID=UPI0012F92642|nr:MULTISPECIES: hypothetical protein [Bradyrhizobium]UFW43091.1 hypothetical protein BcanWSM471_08285 [Bradyrhizobium canariense]